MVGSIALAMSTLDNFRSAASRWSWLLSIALLCFSAIALAISWLAALRDGEIPDLWEETLRAHGPWRYYYPGRAFVWAAIQAPFGALGLAVLAFLVRPNAKAAILIGICLLTMIVVTSTHFWLVD